MNELIMQEPKLAVVIVSWNTKELTRKAVSSALNSRCDSAPQIWVVDNASSDGTVTMLQAEFPQISVIANSQNLGFGRACNQAIAQTNTEYIFFLNPDAELEATTLQRLSSYLDEHPQTGAVGCALRYPNGAVQRSHYPFYSFLGSLTDNALLKKAIAAPENETVKAVDWVIGAVLMLRGTALKQVGVFDEDFFLYGEEMELQYRLHRANWQVVYIPDVAAVHHAGKSAGQARLESTLHNYRGRYLFVRKHYPLYSRWLYLGKAIFALLFWVFYWTLQTLTRHQAKARSSRNLYWQVLRWHLKRDNYKTGQTLEAIIKNT